MVSKDVMFTAVLWTGTRGPCLTARCNSWQHCAACHLAKQSKGWRKFSDKTTPLYFCADVMLHQLQGQMCCLFVLYASCSVVSLATPYATQRKGAWFLLTPRYTRHIPIMRHLILLCHQGPEHMPQMHRILWAYCATLVPPVNLDVLTSNPRCLHVHTTWDILAVKGGTVGENVGW